MIRICYVVTIPGTIEAFFIPQLQILANNGFQVTVICSYSNKLQTELGMNIRYIPVEIPRGLSVCSSIKAIKELVRIFKRERFDIIQYSTPNASFYASIAARTVGCGIRNYHLMGLRYLGELGIYRKVLKMIEKITCANSTTIECVSESNLKMGVSEGLFQKDKGTIVWNGSTGGVDCRRFDIGKREQWRQAVRTELGYSADDFVYGFVGRITRDKGINELLEAFFSLDSNDKLFLIGSIEEDKNLNADLYTCAKNDNNVKFHKVEMDIERYYAAIDVLILPSYREGFGNVIIEAGAVGTPAIVSNIPGPIDAVEDGNTALIIRVKDAKDLAEKMRHIQEIDYMAMGQNAARYVKERFDSDTLCERIFERKLELLGKKV